MMGRVYDALRRAEEQRSRRAQDAGSTGFPLDLPPAAPPDSPSPPAPDPLFPTFVAVSDAPPPTFRPAKGVAAPASIEGGAAHNKRRIAVLQPESAVAEQFRTLRARLDAMSETRPMRTFAVTSAIPGEGKTLAAISLAVVSSMQLGKRVVLVDCDLREGAIAAALGLRLEAGLAEVLSDGAPLERAIQRADGTTLDVLGVRGLPQNPAELLASARMRQLLETLGSRYDRVVIDLPPTLGMPDAKTVCGLCDGTLFVVRADVTQEGEIENALDVLGRERVVGVVMNGAEDSAAKYYGSYR
jgi:capsular exopolysaccharide synthesis family protein